MLDRAKLRAVVFDLDGTLIDSYDAITASVNHVRGLRGLPPLRRAEVCGHVGRGAEHLLRATVPGGILAEDVLRYKQHHPSVMRSLTHLLPGVQSTLTALKDVGFDLAVCSNKPVAFSRDLLASLGIGSLFSAVVGPEDAPRPKPAPDMLLKAMELLARRPDETLYVGDMVVDIDTARGAGVTVWVVPTGSDARSTLQQASPDRLLNAFAELAALAQGAPSVPFSHDTA